MSKNYLGATVDQIKILGIDLDHACLIRPFLCYMPEVLAMVSSYPGSTTTLSKNVEEVDTTNSQWKYHSRNRNRWQQPRITPEHKAKSDDSTKPKKPRAAK
ncbi:hypothetical protein BGZ82_007253 [Podila clonocystis]|nr:hypothetical protein BGZ82_007253 [Podila clonocystis]